jgi:SagB-type dehydrogenase family enzyme
MPSSAVRYRRARHLVGYWQDDSLILHNYESGARLVVPPATAEVLDYFSDWRTAVEFRTRFGVAPRTLATLVNGTLLERSDRPNSERGRALEKWGEWNPVAGLFHMATRDLVFEDSAIADASLRRKARQVPLPPPIKRIAGATRVALPRLRAEGELSRVLRDRRTWRRFSRQPLPLVALGDLLGWTGGVHHWATLRGQGDLPLKTSPSGGARHPLELYVCARRVSGLRPGMYHYVPDRHYLELVRSRDRPVRVQRYLPTQFWYGGAAALVFFTAVFGRYQWKYAEARAYRAVLIEAGHQCQTFCLTATRMGLAPFCSMALADSVIERDLGIDGVSEAVLYAAGVGERPRDSAPPSEPAGYAPLEVRSNPRLFAPNGRKTRSP